MSPTESDWDNAPVAHVTPDQLPAEPQQTDIIRKPSLPGGGIKTLKENVQSSVPKSENPFTFPQTEVPVAIPKPVVPTAPGVEKIEVVSVPAPVVAVKPTVARPAYQAGVSETELNERNVELDTLLLALISSGASDLHLSYGSPPSMRVNGSMSPIPGYQDIILNDRILQKIVYPILNQKQIDEYEHDWELDCSYTIENVSRFRVNVMRQRGHVGAVFRVISENIKALQDLGMPPVLYNLANLPRGLVLVTGQTGSGKSTTLASLIDYANKNRAAHIISIEDPIEYLHSSKLSIVNQREVGADTKSFADALKHVLRQDPDIILLGELRDYETIKVALAAAETGHLVFSTLHTQSAKDTINHIIDVFEGAQQNQIRTQLAATLKSVICQTLIPRRDGQGRIPALEIMMINDAIANHIRGNTLHEIPNAIAQGKREGMQTLDQHLAELVTQGAISRAAAEEVASDVSNLTSYIGTTRTADGLGGEIAQSIGLSGGSL